MSVPAIRFPEGYAFRKGQPMPGAIVTLSSDGIALEPGDGSTPPAVYAIYEAYASQESKDAGDDPLGGPRHRFATLRVHAKKPKNMRENDDGHDGTMVLNGVDSEIVEEIERFQNRMLDLLLRHSKMAGFTRAKE